MLKSVESVYHDGKVQLLETPEGIEESPAIVTFLPSSGRLDLWPRGIDATQVADLRTRLRRFAEDWDRPEMDIYDAP